MTVPPPKVRTSLALIGSFACALFLRCAGLDRLLPHRPEPDAFVVLQTQELQHDPLRAVEQNYFERYPLLIATALACWPPGPLPARVDPAPGSEGEPALAAHLARAAQPYTHVRAAVALLSALLAPLTYLLARRFVRPRAALAAAALVATSLLSLLFAQEARPHGITATLVLGSVLAALALRERPTIARWGLATLLAAASLASLQSGVFALPPLAAAGWLGAGGRAWRLGKTIVALTSAGSLALLFYSNRPYVDARGLHLARADRGGHTISPSDWNGLGVPRGAVMLWEHDPLLAAGAALGLAFVVAAAIRRRRAPRSTPAANPEPRARDVAIVLAFVLPYSAVVGLNGEIYERFLIPLLPYLALLAVLPVEALAARLRTPAAPALYAALLAFPSTAAFCYARAALGPDTQEQAARWIEREVPREARIVTTWGLFLPLLVEPTALAEGLADRSATNSPWYRYLSFVPSEVLARSGRPIRVLPNVLAFSKQGAGPPELAAYLDRVDPDYIVIEETPRRERWALLSELHQQAQRRGELVFTSEGSAPDPLVHDLIDYQAVRHLATRIFSTRAFGPKVLVYKIRR